MAVFAVTYDYSEDEHARDQHRPAHRSFLRGLADEGVLLLSGPLVGHPPGALIVLEADSEDAARSLLREDPFQQLGLIDRVGVRGWTPLLGTRLR